MRTFNFLITYILISFLIHGGYMHINQVYDKTISWIDQTNSHIALLKDKVEILSKAQKEDSGNIPLDTTKLITKLQSDLAYNQKILQEIKIFIAEGCPEGDFIALNDDGELICQEKEPEDEYEN
jgi:hypothetical protein